MDRYTRKDAEAQFTRLISAIGGRVATRFDDHGAYQLDWNATYGGGVIEKIDAKDSGVSHPFGSGRKNAREFCAEVNFAIRVLEVKG